MEKRNKKVEAAEASKQAILGAAETLFARKGYEATSLQEISDLAGVTRGLPNYFFGSKENLYQEVISKLFQWISERLQETQKRLRHSTASQRELFAELIGDIYDSLLQHPTFVRLTGWEALRAQTALVDSPALVSMFQDALGLFHGVKWKVDPIQLIIDVTALCWFPLAHRETFLRPLGIDGEDPHFLQQRRQHVIELMLAQLDFGDQR